MFIEGGWISKSNEVNDKIPIDLNGSVNSTSCTYEKHAGFSANCCTLINAGLSEELLQMICRERQH